MEKTKSIGKDGTKINHGLNRQEKNKMETKKTVKEYYTKNYGYAGFIAQVTTGCCGWDTACWDYYEKGINKVVELKDKKFEKFISELHLRIDKIEGTDGNVHNTIDILKEEADKWEV